MGPVWDADPQCTKGALREPRDACRVAACYSHAASLVRIHRACNRPITSINFMNGPAAVIDSTCAGGMKEAKKKELS